MLTPTIFMKDHSPSGLRQISWNGIAVNVPQGWEVRAAGNQHLIFERSFQAILEIRWQKTATKTLDQCIKSSKEQYVKLTGRKLSRHRIPASAKEAFTDFDVQCRGVADTGIVLVFLLHRPSATYIMAQLHEGGNTDILWRLLASLCCPNLEQEQVTWKIQDFQIDIPPGFRLVRFTMEAGMSTLSFENSNSLLQICRLAPADLRLQTSSLEEIFAALLDQGPRPSTETDASGRLVFRRSPGILRQIGMRLRRQKPFIQAAFWHNSHANRLQGVFWHSVQPPAEQLHSRICASYEIIPI